MEIGWTGMVPDREYILYVYAIEFNEEGSDYTMASPVFYESVVLPTYDYEDLLFDVDVTVDGPMVHYDFTPLNWNICLLPRARPQARSIANWWQARGFLL